MPTMCLETLTHLHVAAAPLSAYGYAFVSGIYEQL